MNLFTLQFPPASSYFLLIASQYPPQFLFSNNFGLNSSTNTTDQVLHQQTTKIVVSQDTVKFKLENSPVLILKNSNLCPQSHRIKNEDLNLIRGLNCVPAQQRMTQIMVQHGVRFMYWYYLLGTG
jgi:hypothetical protein